MCHRSAEEHKENVGVYPVAWPDCCRFGLLMSPRESRGCVYSSYTPRQMSSLHCAYWFGVTATGTPNVTQALQLGPTVLLLLLCNRFTVSTGNALIAHTSMGAVVGKERERAR